MKRRTALLWLLLLVAVGGLWYVRRDRSQATPQEQLAELRVQAANGWIDERALLERLAELLRRARRDQADRFAREVRLERARVLLDVGASEEASRELEELLVEAPEDRARYLRLLVRADVDRGELDRALQRLDELAEVQPDTPEAWVETGQLLVQRARATVDERMRLLEFKLTSSEVRRANELLDRLLAQDEEDPARAATMNEFRELFLASEEGEVGEMLGAADRASSDVRRARRAFARSVALGLDPQAVGGLVRILYDAGEAGLALRVGQLTASNAAVRQDRETTRALLAAMLELGHVTAAGELAREWVLSSDRPMDRDFLRLACEALYRAELWGPLTVATNKLRSVGARDDFLGAMAYLGIAQFEQDMTDKAQLSLERFTRNRVAEPLPGVRARAWFALAEIARAEGADAREREALTGALEADPMASGERWLRLCELQQDAPHLGYRVPLHSLGIAMCRSPERTDELLVDWRTLGEAALRAEGRDVEQVYSNLLTLDRTVARLDLGPYVLFRVAELYAADGNWHGALANLRRVFDELPGFLPAVDLAIRAELELGRPREANERIVERFEITGGDAASLAWLDEAGTAGLSPSRSCAWCAPTPSTPGGCSCRSTCRAGGGSRRRSPRCRSRPSASAATRTSCARARSCSPWAGRRRRSSRSRASTPSGCAATAPGARCSTPRCGRRSSPARAAWSTSCSPRSTPARRRGAPSSPARPTACCAPTRAPGRTSCSRASRAPATAARARCCCGARWRSCSRATPPRPPPASTAPRPSCPGRRCRSRAS